MCYLKGLFFLLKAHFKYPVPESQCVCWSNVGDNFERCYGSLCILIISAFYIEHNLQLISIIQKLYIIKSSVLTHVYLYVVPQQLRNTHMC